MMGQSRADGSQCAGDRRLLRHLIIRHVRLILHNHTRTWYIYIILLQGLSGHALCAHMHPQEDRDEINAEVSSGERDCGCLAADWVGWA